MSMTQNSDSESQDYQKAKTALQALRELPPKEYIATLRISFAERTGGVEPKVHQNVGYSQKPVFGLLAEFLFSRIQADEHDE